MTDQNSSAAEAVALKPCPFCGHQPEMEDGGDRPWVIGCRNPNCLVLCDMDGADTKALARKAWNQRAVMPTPEPARDPVVASLKLDLEAKDCLMDSQYKVGVKLGWSLCAADDEAGYQRVTSGTEHIAELSRIRAERAAIDPCKLPGAGEAASFTALEAWQELVEYDDRTSPEEHPDMALITFEELRMFMSRTAFPDCTCGEVAGEDPECPAHAPSDQEQFAESAKNFSDQEKLVGQLGLVAKFGPILKAAFPEADSVTRFHAAHALAGVVADSPPQDGADESALLTALRDESWDLRCFNIATGGDDADIGWRVVGHWMAEPRERTIAEVFHDSPRDAVREALRITRARQIGEGA